MRGLNDGEYQFVPPCTPGNVTEPERLRRLDGAAALVETAGPVHVDERVAANELAGRAIEHVEKAVAIRPEHELAARSAGGRQVDEHGNLHGVVVVIVVRRELEVPLELARVGVERDDAVGVQIVAGTLRRVPVGAGIADAPIREIERRVVRAREPHRRAAVLPRVAAIRPRLEPGSPGAGIV